MPLTIGEKDQLARTANECARLLEVNRLLKADNTNLRAVGLCAVDTGRGVLAIVEGYKQENDKLREALQFYACKHTWGPMRNGEEEPIWNDYGDTACLALGVPCLERPTTEDTDEPLNIFGG